MSYDSYDLAEVMPPFFDDELPVDRRKCRLLGPTALVVQALMGVLVILSLVYKRHRESPKRPWRIWAFDISKQVVGQMFIHGMNLIISGVGAHHASSNPCALYFLNILVDTTLGVALIYFIHRFLTHVFSDKLQLKGFRSGQYGSPPSLLYWIRQAAVYVTSLTTMKLAVITLFALWPKILDLGDWLLSWTGGGDGIQVIFVMGLFPITMNILQFWLIDSIVKAASQDNEVLPTSSPRPSADREPLFGPNRSDDDEERDAPVLRRSPDNVLFASSSETLEFSDAAEEGQKQLSSRASTDDAGEASESRQSPSQSPSPSDLLVPRQLTAAQPASPTRYRRKHSPQPYTGSAPRYNVAEFSGAHIPASPKAPYSSQKAIQSVVDTHIELRNLGEKLGSRNGRGDWTSHLG